MECRHAIPRNSYPASLHIGLPQPLLVRMENHVVAVLDADDRFRHGDSARSPGPVAAFSAPASYLGIADATGFARDDVSAQSRAVWKLPSRIRPAHPRFDRVGRR